MAQVEISVQKDQFHRHEQINIAIRNTGQQPVSFCVEFGHWSFKDDSSPMETTSTPGYVQKYAERGWSTLLIGPDVGSSRHSVVLAAGQTQQYPIRLSDTGKMRIVLDYWIGESEQTCEIPPHRKTTISKVFFVREE